MVYTFKVCLTLMLVSLVVFPARLASSMGRNNQPYLAYYLLNSQTIEELSQAVQLSPAEITGLAQLAQQEQVALENLERSSLAVILDQELGIAEKRRMIQQSGYNQQVHDIQVTSYEHFIDTLGAEKTHRVSSWMQRRWRADQQSSFPHTQSLILPSLTAWQLDLQKTFFWPIWPSNSQPGPPGIMARQYPRSYEVWATRYDAGDRYVIALPDKCLKFANAGSLLCNDGYQYNQNYSVAISYKGNLVVATVAESGPWNVDDNYWSSSKDPQPRRMFTDLPQGVPEAQAAFYNGYNSGQDQFGRKVTSPVAIDISYKVAKDLGLPAGNNQVTISFLWTEGWDEPKPNKPKNSTPDKPIENSPGVIRFAVSTPNPDGSIVHVVQSGQTLVGVANVYGIPLQDLLKLNNLSIGIDHPPRRYPSDQASRCYPDARAYGLSASYPDPGRSQPFTCPNSEPNPGGKSNSNRSASTGCASESSPPALRVGGWDLLFSRWVVGVGIGQTVKKKLSPITNSQRGFASSSARQVKL